MDKELLQMALNALERADKISGYGNNKTVIKALRARLAQPDNEFNPDWDAMAVMVEEQQRMAAEIETLKRCLSIEAKLREKNNAL